MTVYVYDPDRNKMVPRGEYVLPQGPYIQADLSGYVSPLGTGYIEGRSARREDMARGGSREVDPSERPEGAGIVKSKAQAVAERAQLASRDQVNLSPETRRRLLER